MFIKKQITYKGKLYGYWVREDGTINGSHIRSEDNPQWHKYLKPGSKMHQQILAEIVK